MKSSEGPIPARRRRWRRRLAWTLLTLVLAVVAIPLLILGGLRIERVRDELVYRISARLEQDSGTAVRVHGIELDPWRGVIVIHGLELARVGRPQEPFLTAVTVRCAFDVRALLGGRLVIRELSVAQPKLLRDALESTGPPREASTPPRIPAALVIRTFEIRDGEIPVRVSPAPEQSALGVWHLTGLDVHGSVADGHARAVITRAGVHVAPLSRPAEFAVEGRVEVAPDGAFEIADAKANGSGFALEASGAGTLLDPGIRFRASYRLTTELASLAADVFSGGSLAVSGGLELEGEGLTGTALVEARDVALDAFERWAKLDLPPALALGGSQADLDGDLAFDLTDIRSLSSVPADAIRGTLALGWRRGATRLLDLSVRAEPDDSRSSGPAARATIRAALFPDEAGERRLEATARMASWTDPERIEIRAATLHASEPALRVALERFGVRVAWPDTIPTGGSLDGRIEASGPLAALRIRGDATWRDGAETLAVIEARTVAGARVWTPDEIALDVSASLLPDTPGTRTAHARLSGLALHDGTARVDVPDLGSALADVFRRAGVMVPQGPPPLDALLSGPLQADVRFDGNFTKPHIAVDAAWQPGGEGTVVLHASGRPIGQAPYLDLDDEAQLEVRGIDAGRFGAAGVVVHSLDAISDGKRVEVRSIAATLPPVTAGSVRGEAAGHGAFDLAWPPRQADVALSVEHPLEGIDRASARLRLDGGIVHLDELDVASGATHAVARGSIPLSALARYAGPLREEFATYPYGPIALEAEKIDLDVLRRVLPLPSDFPNASGVVDFRLAFDPEHPGSASGYLEARAVAFEFAEARVAVDGLVRIDVADGTAVLSPTRLTTAGTGEAPSLPGELSGTAQLKEDWSPGMEPFALIADVSVDFRGTLAAAALARFLKAGTASGSLAIDASVRGPLSDITAKLVVLGPDAKLSFRSPYATRFESPEARLHYRNGALSIESARARWNTGNLTLRGTIDPRGDTDVTAEFGSVAYRLDYGINTRIGGHLQLVWPADGERRLIGTVSIDRATLRRNIALDREVLRTLFEPESVAESPLLETIEADLEITTTQGLQIKNNVADLHADWDSLHVTGTLAAPKVSGQARVVPGGLLNFFGNIVRIDEATFSWSGDPPSAPRVAMKTTSAIEEPTIKNQWYSSWYQAPIQGPGRGGAMDLTAQRASSTEVMDAFASGMMSYYQDRIAGSFGGGATQSELSYEPLSLFGETDTTARMTITQRLSRYAKFVASYNPVDAEAQTFILEVRGLDAAPSLTAQAFTNDEKHEGGTLQQTIRLGKGYEDEVTDRLRKVRIDVPKGVSKRKLRKAISYHPGDALPDASAMDVEFDVLDAMARAGYPLAEATVDTVAHKPRRIDLAIRVVPGPRIRYTFEGDRPRKAARRAIGSLYRFGDDEAASIAEIRQKTVLALQSRGYLDPRVDVSVERAAADSGDAAVTVRVRAEGGRKVDPDAPRFLGVPTGEAEALSALFVTKEARTALAAGTPAADARITRALAASGYPSARVTSREISENGRDLVVRLEPGDRLRIASVALRGLPPADEQRLTPLLGVREGDPLEAERVAGAVLVVERDMMSKGHAQADIRARLEPVSPDRPLDRALILDASPGPAFEIDSVAIRGTTASNPRWLEKTAGLTAGTPADPGEVSKARTRLAQTGVFEEIRVSTDPPIARSARTAEVAAPGLAVPTAVVFDLAERKRWQLGYGGRYESEVGFGVMLNLDNLNSLGRGHTTGFRSIYGEEHKSLQLYHLIPRAFGERSSLEGFVQWKKELTEGVWSEGEQAWMQASLPLSKRWQNRVYAVVENRTLTSEEPDTPLDQRAISPRLGWQLVFDSRVLPTAGLALPKGFFYGLNLIGASERLWSDVTSLGTYQQWTYYLPFGDPKRGRVHWAQSYRVSTINVSDDTVPFDSRLRAGGEFSVRGYPTNSLGPLDEEGNAIGGELMAIANEELHVNLWKTVSGLVFVDVGNVWPTLGDFDGRFSSSYGLGLRWASPVGPLRLDWAVPINPRPGDPRRTYYFGFGNVF